jgi:uncharacterized protein
MLTRLLLLSAALIALGACTRLFFHPMAQQVFDPATAGIVYEAVDFEATDGTRLHGWFLPSQLPDVEGTVLFLYGNAENKSTHIASVYWMPEHGYNVFLFDYRGYGGSGGRPTLSGLHDDIESALRYLISRPEPSTKHIIVFGQSLGGALALTAVSDSAWRPHIEGVVVEGAFSGYRAIAREKMAGFWLMRPLAWPFSLTVSDRYDPVDAAARISPIPLLLVYANEDDIVPVHHGEVLYEAARSPKWLWKIGSIAHITAFVDGGRRQDLVALMRSWSGSGTSLDMMQTSPGP